MAEKTKIYKEKINQLSKQLDDQKEIIRSKDNAIENLLARMDELTESLAGKNDEITALKTEISSLKTETPFTKNDYRSKASSSSAKSTKALPVSTQEKSNWICYENNH